MPIKNEHDARNALDPGKRSPTPGARIPYSENYIPPKAERHAWAKALFMLFTMCAAGVGFAYILVVFLAGG